MRQTRRAYLASTAGALTLGTAGCLGGGDGGGAGDGAVTAIGCDVPQRDAIDSLPTPTKGPDDATIVVDGWEDFACPHCATFSLETLPKLESEYISEGIVQYRHHDFPIPVDEWWSWAGASGARAAQDEGDDETFFELAHTFYENQSSLRGSEAEDVLSNVEGYANDLGLDGCSIVAATSRERYRPLLEAERKDAVDDRGFQGTPTVLVNGNQVAPRWEDLKSAVENAR